MLQPFPFVFMARRAALHSEVGLCPSAEHDPCHLTRRLARTARNQGAGWWLPRPQQPALRGSVKAAGYRTLGG